jgi:hypothetical protein
VWPLAPSALARRISHEAARKLYAVLTAAPRNWDVTGLIAATSDGLNMADLVPLTDLSLYELETMLTGSLGRVIGLHGDRSSVPPRCSSSHTRNFVQRP